MRKILFAALLFLIQGQLRALPLPSVAELARVTKDTFTDHRPAPKERLFRSKAIDEKIREMEKRLRAVSPQLWWMFQNCFPNTLDTTVHYQRTDDGDDDTFVYTGDIHAMWLRDSAAQVWPYLPYMKKDKALQSMIRGVIRRQLACICIDPYANAFNIGPTGSEWQTDNTAMKPELHERKYEIDSLCYPIRLAYAYWKLTGDDTIFDDRWLQAINEVLRVFTEQQRRQGNRTSYRFTRTTSALHDTVSNYGYGHPANPVGLIASTFRPSDDSSVFPFLIPSNFFAVSVLRKAAEVLQKVNDDEELANRCSALAAEVSNALKQYAIVDHPRYGRVYAFEVDGFGSHLLMDDANAPSLLSLPYLTDVPVDDPVYQNTRRMIWSTANPYFFQGRAAEGIGSPHTGYDNVWPMSLIMKALTSTSRQEQEECLQLVMQTDGGTGFVHESFQKDDATRFTRSWFAWANTLFGELVLRLYGE